MSLSSYQPTAVKYDSMVVPENTHHRGKYHCMADLLFDWFGFDQTSKYVANSKQAKRLNPKKIIKRSTVQ